MMRPRILHVISDLDRGGSELHLAKLLPHLEPYFSNHVASLIGQGEVGELLKTAGIPVHYLHLKHQFDLRSSPRLRQLFKNLSPSLIVTNLLFADISSRLALTGLSIPLISNQRSSLPGREYLRLLDRLTRHAVTHFIAQTPHMKKVIRQQVRAPLSSISIIPNIVEQTRPLKSRTSVRQRLGLSPSDMVIICVSNLRPHKGHQTLISAFTKLRQLSVVRSQLLLVGSGPLRASLEQQVHQAGLTANVHFLGVREDIPELLSASDIFVLPSEAEGMSNALLEAMAAELPCIASEIPGNRALIIHHSNGLLFRAGDVEHLTHTLTEILPNRLFHVALGKAAHEYIQTHHHPHHIANQWRTVITNALA